jgi:hypothetical protein
MVINLFKKNITFLEEEPEEDKEDAKDNLKDEDKDKANRESEKEIKDFEPCKKKR